MKSLRQTRRQPTHPLLMQVSILLQERASPTPNVRSHSPLPLREIPSLTKPPQQGHSWSPLSRQTNSIHSHTNKKGLHAHFPHIALAQPQRIIKTRSSCASSLPAQLYKWWAPVPEASNSMSYGKSISSISSGRQEYVFITIGTYISYRLQPKRWKLNKVMLFTSAIMCIP